MKKVFLIFSIFFIYKSSLAATWPNTELECLAANIYFEARGEPISGQYMVAFVTINRVKDPNFPKTICKVVKQDKQFSWFNTRKVKKPKKDKYWKKAVYVAKNVMQMPYSYIKKKSKGATFYHADYVDPYWNKEVYYVTKIDSHIFYR